GNTSKGFSYLDRQMGGSGTSASSSTTPDGVARSKVWRSFPNNFIFSGDFYGSSANGRGYNGSYWSSTANNYTNSYHLYLYGTSLSPGNSTYNKYCGYSVRCVVDN
ncbi:hypothetical protein IJH72_01470, partial [Candidatus Saccharibacteria bacterium]|nr:hypothetical protein [Candidatus Saccharibacteria bacterium]